MDVKESAQECHGVFVEIAMIDGSTRRGTIQKPTPGADPNVLAFLDERKAPQLPDGDIAVSPSAYFALVDFIPLRRITAINPIETNIGGLAITTVNGKNINDDGMQVRLRNILQPGYIGVSYKMPGWSTWSEEKVVRIVNGQVTLPVTMVFLSYAKEDRAIVEDLANRLRQRGIFVWEDEALLLPGDQWESRIEHAIGAADYFILLMSAKTLARDGYKNRELRLALKKQTTKAPNARFIIPILADPCDPPSDLAELQWLRMSDDGWEAKLLRAIGPFHANDAEV